MKIAISAEGPTVEGRLSLHFGRTPYFILCDTENGNVQVVDNAASQNAVQGAGIQSAQTLANLGVQAVITGQVGPKAWTALQAANIQVYAVNGGTVEQARNAFKTGQLQPATGANAAGR